MDRINRVAELLHKVIGDDYEEDINTIIEIFKYGSNQSYRSLNMNTSNLRYMINNSTNIDADGKRVLNDFVNDLFAKSLS
jgi:hypothetical protein